MSLLNVGTVAFDEIHTPTASSGRILGGAAYYIALSATYFTRPVHLVSVVGNDYPDEVIDQLHQRGVTTGGLERRSDAPSFFWEGRYHDDMNQRDTLTTELNVLADFAPKVPADAQNPDFVMLGNLTPAVQLSVLDQLQARPKLIAADTMNFWIDSQLDDLKKLLKRIDLLMINDEEARMLSGEHSLAKAAEAVMAMGPRYLTIKKGEHGALLFHEDKMFYCPALPLKEVFDPTGAGDTFAGGFMGYLAQTGQVGFESLKQAMVYGSAMASFCVERFGVEGLLHLDNAQIQRRVQAFADMMTVNLPENAAV